MTGVFFVFGKLITYRFIHASDNDILFTLITRGNNFRAFIVSFGHIIGFGFCIEIKEI